MSKLIRSHYYYVTKFLVFFFVFFEIFSTNMYPHSSTRNFSILHVEEVVTGGGQIGTGRSRDEGGILARFVAAMKSSRCQHKHPLVL